MEQKLQKEGSDVTFKYKCANLRQALLVIKKLC